MTQSPPPPEPLPEQVGRPRIRHERLPVSEATFDRPGGPSPFGEDVAFPLPEERLRYRHE